MFTTGYKIPAEGGLEAFALILGFCFLLWGFFVWQAFIREKIAEGKTIAKGEWLKRDR
jgi:hypothetical protein